MNDALNLMLTRRSTSVKDMTTPAPSDAELEQILRVATRVPDHGKLTPWRIIVLKEKGQKELGLLAEELFLRRFADATDAEKAAERNRFARAPLCLAVLSTPVQDSKPVWEQEMSAAAVCMNILHAANALGYGAKWLTEWVAYHGDILSALGGRASDKIAGFIYLGTKKTETDDRARPKLSDVVEWR